MPDTLSKTEVRPLLLDLAGVAAALQVSERQVRRLIASGDFGPAALRIGRRTVRVRAAELTSWTGAGCPPRTRWTWKPVGKGSRGRETSPGGEVETPKSTDRKMEAETPPQPPDGVRQALFLALWRLPNWLKWPIIISLILFWYGLRFWQALPDATKQKLVDWITKQR